MLLATGIAALSRKVKDDRDRKKEARQGVLNVGPSDVAMRAFEAQKTRTLEAGNAGAVERAGTQIKHEDPDDFGTDSPDGERGIMDPEKPDLHDARRASNVDVGSPVQSEPASMGVMSPMDQTLTMTSTSNTRHDGNNRPPTYSSRAESSSGSAKSPSSVSREERSRNLRDETSRLSSQSTNSVGTHAVRVKTKGANLSSGFPYPSSLFDLKVHPDKWTSFTEQVVHATKVDASDSRKAWAAATATAMSGAVITSVFLKKSMDRSYQEKHVKAGISDMSEGKLGSLLQSWNDQYFAQQGLFVHLELSESAMKNEEQRSKAFRKPALLYGSREERERKGEERKYVIVVTKLDADGAPTEALREMELNEQATAEPAVTADPVENLPEMPGDTYRNFLIPELPGDDGLGAAELPGGVSLGFSSGKAMQPPPGFAELEPDSQTTLAADQTVVKEMEDTSREAGSKSDEKGEVGKERVRKEEG